MTKWEEQLKALLNDPRTGLRDSSDTNKTRYAILDTRYAILDLVQSLLDSQRAETIKLIKEYKIGKENLPAEEQRIDNLLDEICEDLLGTLEQFDKLKKEEE